MSGSRPSLLHALDGQGASFAPLETSRAINSASPNRDRKKMLQEARMRQALDTVPGSSQATADTDFLARSLTSRPSKTTSLATSSGFHLNYDDSTPVRAIDVGGADQQQKLAEFVTSAIDNHSHGITVKDAMKELGLSDSRDIIPGMEVRLLPHQVIGVQWMLNKEKSKDRGGLLADDMGLGKTIQMLATMVKNAPDEDSDCRTTLIVVPAALLLQWKDEILSKTNGMFNVHIHHGKDKLKKVSEVKRKDVVITTYQTLNQDFGIPTDLTEDEIDEYLSEKGGVLARTKFYRAIVDEAQFIRNRSTMSSISVAYVRAKYRWLLTGTPVTNTLADIYGLIRFGRFRPWNDWNDFNEHVAKEQSRDAPLAGQRAQAILRPILLRRTKNSTLEGEPILQLPTKHIELKSLQFSKEERELYDSMENKTQITINKFIRAGTLMKNHAYVLVLILRLRQMCCHPYLTLALSEEENPMDSVSTEAEKELNRARRVMGQGWVDVVKKRFLNRERAANLIDYADEKNAMDDNCPVCKDLYEPGAGRVLPCCHEVCSDCLIDLQSSDIAHDGIFGHGNEKENLAIEKEFENARAKGLRPCPKCKKMWDLKGPKVFKSIAFEPSDDELRERKDKKKLKRSTPDSDDDDSEVEVSPVSTSKVKKSSFALSSFDDDMLADSDDELTDLTSMFKSPEKKSKKQKTNHKSAFDDDSDVEVVSSTNTSPSKSPSKGKRREPSKAIVALWRKGDDDIQESTKMLQLLTHLKEWDSTGDKTIVYSQWTSMLDLLEKLFSRYGLRSLRYDGKMDRGERERTLAQFKEPYGCKIILISTRSGSVGLNLTAANRVINMDLSWNYAAESQAYDRAHRIGQEKEVFVKRLVVKDTIEERMLQLQDVKTGLAEAALGEGNGGKLHKLSVKDIKYLFGMTKTDSKDKNKTKQTKLGFQRNGGDDDSDTLSENDSD